MNLEFTDQLGRKILLENRPLRVVSLVPSITEFLSDLGLNDEVIGITKFCVFPADWRRAKNVIGGTKTVNIQEVIDLRPDLIIANKEENVREQIEELEALFPVWISDVKSIEDNFDLVLSLGNLFSKNSLAETIVLSTKKALHKFKGRTKKEKVLYLIWKNPYMAAGGDTFINAVIEAIGFENVVGNENRYPELSVDDIQSLEPNRIFLSSEPFPFKEKHVEELQKILPSCTIQLVDGTLFSWYGSRMQKVDDLLYLSLDK